MEPVSHNDLLPGKEYYIQCLTLEKDEFTIVPNKRIEKLIATFNKLESTQRSDGFKLAHFKYFRSLQKKDFEKGYDVRLNEMWRFYEVKKAHIQQKMENRALNMILRQVIGDEYFYIEF
jgi:hypothetical protein